MSQPYYAPPPKPADATNALGLIGLILSMTGFIMLITAPIGLVLSLMGLKHPDKGLAVAGTVVGIFSTLWAAVWLCIALAYFGMIGALFGTMCCMASSVASGAAERVEQQQAAAEIATAQLGQHVTVDLFNITGTGDSRQASGIALYAGEGGKQMAVDFSCQLDKVDGTWEASNFQRGTAYERTPPATGFEPYDPSSEPMDESGDAPESTSEPGVESGEPGIESDAPDDSDNGASLSRTHALRGNARLCRSAASRWSSSIFKEDAERQELAFPRRRSHAERGNESVGTR
jgi:hypothetical protein